MLKGVESYKYLSELWAFLVVYAKSSRRDDCKMHILRSDAFLLCQIGLVARLGRFIAVPE